MILFGLPMALVGCAPLLDQLFAMLGRAWGLPERSAFDGQTITFLVIILVLGVVLVGQGIEILRGKAGQLRVIESTPAFGLPHQFTDDERQKIMWSIRIIRLLNPEIYERLRRLMGEERIVIKKIETGEDTANVAEEHTETLEKWGAVVEMTSLPDSGTDLYSLSILAASFELKPHEFLSCVGLHSMAGHIAAVDMATDSADRPSVERRYSIALQTLLDGARMLVRWHEWIKDVGLSAVPQREADWLTQAIHREDLARFVFDLESSEGRITHIPGIIRWTRCPSDIERLDWKYPDSSPNALANWKAEFPPEWHRVCAERSPHHASPLSR